MSGQRNRKKRIPVKETVIVFAIVAVLAIIFLIAAGPVYRGSPKNQPEIEEGVRVLKEQEAKAPVNFEINQPAEIKDLSAEQEKIMSMTEEDFKPSWFQGTVLLGDSITLAAEEYEVMGPDVIIARIGAGLENSEDLLEDAISRNPSVVFFAFGNNDISSYLGDPSLFVDQYRTTIQKFKEALPNTVFYICDILPVQPGYEAPEGFEYRDAYNSALEAFCEETENVYYINSDFLLEKDPGLYDADGIHPVRDFYPKWLTYLADCAGLSDTAEDE